MTCKNCIHEAVCDKLCPNGLLPYQSTDYPAEIFCLEFKNQEDVAPVVHGEWIPIVSYYHGKPDGRYYCSVCHRVETMKGIYCRLCGALMDGGNK